MSWFTSKEEQLIREVGEGNIAKVTKLINAGANINYRSKDGQMSPLDGAVIKKNSELIKHLLAKGAAINSTTQNGYTALHLACMPFACDINIVDTLINNGADVNKQSLKERWAPLLLAACQAMPSSEVIKRLIEAGAFVDSSNDRGMTPLMYLAAFGDDEIVNCLLENGANPNLTNSEGFSPLNFAASSDGNSFITMFKANIDMTVEMNKLAVTYHEGMDSIEDNYNNKNHAVRPRVAQLLLDHGANINNTTKTGETPLISAIVAKNTEVAKTLIRSGASVTQIHPLGLTALHFAAKNGDINIINMLIEHDADINSAPPKSLGETALMTAVWNEQIDAVRLLIQKGADVKITKTSGENAVMWAVHKKNIDIVGILVEAGAD